MELRTSTEALRLYDQSLIREVTNPDLAVRGFRQAAEETVDTYRPLFLASLLALPVAYAIAYATVPTEGSLAGPIAVAILCVVGAGPAALLLWRREAAIRARVTGGKPDVNPFVAVWGGGWMLFLLVFSTTIQVLIIGFIGALVSAVLVVLPYELIHGLLTGSELVPKEAPAGLSLVGGVVGIGIVFLVVASDVRRHPFSPLRIAREIPLGLAAHRGQILEFLASVLLIVLFAGAATRHELIYENFALGVLLFAIDGASLGWSLCRTSVDPHLSALAQLGVARCRFGPSQRAKTYYELSAGLDQLSLSKPYQRLGGSTLMLLSIDPEDRRMAEIVARGIRWADEEMLDLELHPGPDQEPLLYPDRFAECLQRLRDLITVEDEDPEEPTEGERLVMPAERAAGALLGRGREEARRGRLEEALSTFEEMETRFGEAEETALRQLAAWALVEKGVTLGRLNRREEEIAAYEEVVDRYGDEWGEAQQRPVVAAEVNRGVALSVLGRHEEARSTLEPIVRLYGDADDPKLRAAARRAARIVELVEYEMD